MGSGMSRVVTLPVSHDRARWSAAQRQLAHHPHLAREDAPDQLRAGVGIRQMVARRAGSADRADDRPGSLGECGDVLDSVDELEIPAQASIFPDDAHELAVAAAGEHQARHGCSSWRRAWICCSSLWTSSSAD
jgi:hypothetical protein